MGNENKSNFLTKILSNALIKNILIMAVLSLVLIFITLYILQVYTRHNHSAVVPELKGMQVSDAAAIVKAAKLDYEVVDSLYQDDGVPGAILEQIPKGASKVKEGRTIYLTIQSVNEPFVAVPDLENASLRQSETSLRTLGFNNITIEYIPSEYRDLVYSIEYDGKVLGAGQKIPKSSRITIKVGDGNSPFSSGDSLDIDDGNIPPLDFGGQIDDNF
ncbi:MAG TPA: PASTA domain-containing protein [Dysgonomonas sp.]|nr:PASTA domain-containing protein [Dysgonomonas sp.]